uniref:Transposase n=1 Tax=Panagrolaimus superbus TaxID=310955 RepID=A0A914YW04_9BILA
MESGFIMESSTSFEDFIECYPHDMVDDGADNSGHEFLVNSEEEDASINAIGKLVSDVIADNQFHTSSLEDSSCQEPQDISSKSIERLLNDVIAESQLVTQISALDDVERFNNSLFGLFTGVYRPATSTEIVTFTDCCVKKCTMFLSRFLIDHLRCALPLEKSAMQEFQFHLTKQFVINGQFNPVVASRDVCETIFASIYCISTSRLQTLLKEINDGQTQTLPHGNFGSSPKTAKFYERMAKIVVLLEEHAQDLPNKSGYVMSRGITQKDLMKLVSPDESKQLLPKHYLSGIKPALHWRASNDLTKCKYCSVFRCSLFHQKVINKEEVRQHRENHWANINADRLDYFVRKIFSLTHPQWLLSITHDGMSKHKSKVPHFLWNRAKFIIDADLAFCNLNGVIIHRKDKNGGDFVVDGYFNLSDVFPGGTNLVASQLIMSIVKTAPIPPVVAIQLDNCSVNKSYSMIATLGWLLIKQTTVKEFYLCFNEVGHTHIDVDALFGRYSQALSKKECPTPQALLDLFQKQQGVRQSTVDLKVYDFTTFLAPYQNNFGNLKNNHMFRIFIGSDNTPKVQIAHYIRSSKWLKSVPDAETWDYNVFKKLPPLNEEPPALLPSVDKLQKLQHTASAARQLLSEEEMKDYLSLVADIRAYVPTPFANILSLFSETVSETHNEAASNVLLDPHNKAIEKFMKEHKENISKIWNSLEVTNLEEAVYSNDTAELLAEESTVPEEEPTVSLGTINDNIELTPPPLTAPKKRGRKKNIPEERQSAQNAAASLPAEQLIVSLDEIESDATLPPPKKRGRPRKNPVL